MVGESELVPADQVAQSYRFIVEDIRKPRLDLFLSRLQIIPDLTRSKIQQLIRNGFVLVNNEMCKTGHRLMEHDVVTVAIPPPQPVTLTPEKVEFRHIFEDDDLAVISKPPGVVVHPSCGHQSGTLVHGLLFHYINFPSGNEEQRPGIVHRLDKDTSGIMVVAKNDPTRLALMQQFKSRQIEKKYLAVLDGRLTPQSGRITEAIGRHPVHRKKMAVRQEGGRESATAWNVLEEFQGFCYVQLLLETGRTHQIRVHMSYLGHPVTGDSTYGSNKKEYEKMGVTRHCLHAHELTFIHPHTHERMHFEAPLWEDMARLLTLLRGGG